MSSSKLYVSKKSTTVKEQTNQKIGLMKKDKDERSR